MKKVLIAAAWALAVAGCSDNSAGQDKPLFDTTAKATPRPPDNKDTVGSATPPDSASASGSSVPAASGGGGIPKGTIDSGLMNQGAHPGRSKKAKPQK